MSNDNLEEEKAREEKAREEKAREEKAREEKAREEKARDRTLNFKSTLLATLIGVFVASFLTYGIAELLNYKSAKQSKREEVESIIKLLNIAKKDVDLNKGVDKALEKNTEKANQKSDEDIPASAFEIYSSPGIGAPYPIVFEKVINDDRVLSYLSFTGLASLYRTQKALEEQRAYMMNPCITDKLYVFDKSDNVKKLSFVDKSCIADKLYVFNEYKLNLERASDLLEDEIKYIRKQVSEAKVFESYKENEMKRYNLTKEQKESLPNFQ